jgi:hypothetical protein
MVRYPSDEHDEVQDNNDDAVGNRYEDMIGVGGGQEAVYGIYTRNNRPEKRINMKLYHPKEMEMMTMICNLNMPCERS